MNRLRQKNGNRDLALAGMFLCLIFVPLVMTLCDPSARRHFSQFWVAHPELDPAANLHDWRNFDQRIEDYFNNNFGSRRFFNVCYVTLKGAFFSDDPAPDIVAGTDGWLYYRGADFAFNHLNQTHESASRLGDWRRVLERRRDWLTARGITYLVVIAPNKETIYPSHLPSWLRQQSRTRLDEFLTYMRAHTRVDILDLREPLQKEAATTPLYYRTDSHWNLMGGFIASKAIAAALAGKAPGIRTLSLAEFSVARTIGQAGDLARASKLTWQPEENVYSFVPLEPRPGVHCLINGSSNVDLKIFGTVPVPKFGTIAITNPAGGVRLAVIGDSFSFALAPFLGYQFKKTDIFWQQNMDTNLIQRLAPNVVITEIVERHLNAVAPPD